MKGKRNWQGVNPLPGHNELRPNARDRDETRGKLAYVMPPVKVQSFGDSSASARVTNPLVAASKAPKKAEHPTNLTPGYDRAGTRRPSK